MEDQSNDIRKGGTMRLGILSMFIKSRYKYLVLLQKRYD